MERGRLKRTLVPSIGEALFISLLLRTLMLGRELLNDGDTGWHVMTGEFILSGNGIPDKDIFSHTMPGAPWTSNEWLSDVVFAAVHRLAGLNGVVVVSAVLISVTFYVLYEWMIKRGVSPLTSAAFTLFAASVSSLHWLARPHLFSFFFTLGFFAILEGYQRKGPAGGAGHIIYLPLLTALWVNLHGGFMLGVTLVFVYAFGNAVMAAASASGRDDYRRRFRTLGLAALVCVLAAFVNPHGAGAVKFALKLMSQDYVINNLVEWRSPDFHEIKAFEYMLLCYFAIFVMSKRRPDIFEGAVLVMLLHMSLVSTRFIPLMAIVATPMAASRAGDAIGQATARAGGTFALFKRRVEALASRTAALETRYRARFWSYAAVAACAGIALNGGMLGDTRLMDYRYDGAKFPVDALVFAEQNGVSGNMFNNFGWGGYIIYKGYPRYKVFIDGRFEPYETPLLKEYKKVENSRPGMDAVLDKYKVDWVIYNSGSVTTRLLEARGGWKTVYSDGTADILLRETTANAVIIDRSPQGTSEGRGPGRGGS